MTIAILNVMSLVQFTGCWNIITMSQFPEDPQIFEVLWNVETTFKLRSLIWYNSVYWVAQNPHSTMETA
jgi:hypothetical protein